MEKISFEIETITPMFLSGADQSKAELRPASIKGLLRFWWRALQAEKNIENLKKREIEIFGGSGENVENSKFSIRISNTKNIEGVRQQFPQHNITVRTSRGSFNINILEYLAYGTFNYQRGRGNVFIRNYIPTNTKFNLEINFYENKYISDVLTSLSLLFLFGGLGSRNRNGFGSFSILNSVILKNKNIKTDVSIIRDIIKNNLDELPYPAFVKGTKLFKTKNYYDSWDKALAEIGKIYRGIRCGEILLEKKQFETKHNYNKRIYLGAPLIGDTRNNKAFLDRHSKPYFIKISKEDNRYVGYILYLPSQYCEGLINDINGRQIKHSYVNAEFKNICNEFNLYLADKFDVVF